MSDTIGMKAGPCREKYWSELNADEKIKRMREQVRYLERRLEGMSRKIDNLGNHNHLEGKIVVPFNSYESTSEKAGQTRNTNPDDVYF